MSTEAVRAQGLGKDYRRRTAVQGLDLAIAAGEVFGLLGPNGAGKTTTILMLLGLTDATRGSVRVLGHDPWRDAMRVKQSVGYMPDSVGFYDYLSARDNLRYTARLLGIAPAERDGRIDEALARVELLAHAEERVKTFSHGMRRRLGLAEILLKRAPVAMLDEPTSGLDPQATESFLRLIAELRQGGTTVILSSHLLDQMQRICDRVALFDHGRIFLTGSVSELAREVLGGYGFEVRIEASGPDLAPALRALPDVGEVRVDVQPGQVGSYVLQARSDVRAHAAEAAVAAGAGLRGLTLTTPSLERIYQRAFAGRGAA